jgi:hypothetical protein
VEAGVRHDETVVANLRHVRVETVATGLLGFMKRPQVFFCDIGPIEIVSREGAGDDAPLPEGVRLGRGFSVPDDGFVDMLNVRIHPNGMINLVRTQDTRVEESDMSFAHSAT